MPTVREYLDDSGRSPFASWFDRQSAQAAAKVTAHIARLAAGNRSNVEPVGGGEHERRIDWGPGLRIYFGNDGRDLIILLAGSEKSDQRREISRACAHSSTAGVRGAGIMALTKEFQETVRARAGRDRAFRLALLREALDTLLEGDVTAGKALLRDYTNATVGFEALAQAVKTPVKSLHRMLSPRGNPTADNLFRILAALQHAERVDARVRLRRTA